SGTGIAAGKTCSACGGRGIPAGLYSRLPGEINQDALKEFGAGIVLMGPEELLPNPALIDWAKEMGAAYDVRFAVIDDLLSFTEPFRTDLENVAEADLDPRVELNPNNAGVWVSRIKTKQIVRRQEQALLALESLLVMSRLRGNDFPAQILKAIRQKMYFTMFHDAITATHVDAAYQELMEIMEEIDGGLQLLEKKVLTDLSSVNSSYSVINPFGAAFSGTARVQVPWHGGAIVQDKTGSLLPVVACVEQDADSMEVEFLVEKLQPFSALSIQMTPAEAHQTEVILLQEDSQTDGPSLDFFNARTGDAEEEQQTFSIENSRFQVEADHHGLIRVYDKLLARDILITDEFRPAELILEHDEGSPWATLSPDFTRTSLSSLTQLKRVEKSSVVQQLVFAVGGKFGMGYAGMPLRGEMRVRLVEGLDRVEFDFKTYWATFNHRLRVAMPVPKTDSSTARYWYDIPYGVLERQSYEPTFTWFGANGDWPAIHWAGVEQPGLSVALFNRGTPSYRMETGKSQSEVMFLSLLRSPAIPTYLHEPYFYTMTDYDGMRDEGDHAFSFAVSAYDQPFTESSVVLDGEAYQQVLPVAGGKVMLPAMPQVQSDNVRLAAIKWAEKDEGMVMRLVEYRGEPGQVEITVPQGFGGVEQVNLLEETLAVLPVVGHKVSLALRPWEIASLKLSMTGKPPAEPSI
ncbi:MAG: glycosyl hydrolase-related protein, partial [Anaerolineae bacterium]|nr:glycosyl hydrolase-related protein [Anaerolineae bacterium]